jgi:hypothetical protein
MRVHIARAILALVFAILGLDGFLGFIFAVLPGGIETLFREGIDLSLPYDRTLNRPTEAA